MKVAIIHLSDFHIVENERFSKVKIDEFMESLNILGDVDEYIIAFSGDLAYSGKINEYKASRYLFGQIIRGLKQKNGNRFIPLLLTPGNHDLCLPEGARVRSEIQQRYDSDTIDEALPTEYSYLDNYYQHSNANGRVPFDKMLERRFYTYSDYKIQFNIINTAPFSTLAPNDKELHYFPKEKLYLLKKSEDANLCITIMHHNVEWFYWNCKSDLEKTIIDNSEILMTGHDHQEKISTVSINNSMDIWISASGEMNFDSCDKKDSFNIVLIDTEKNSFDGYVFEWNSDKKIYMHSVCCKQKTLQSRSSQMLPLPSYIKSLKEDAYNHSDDFTKYFVFPKLISDYKNELGKYVEVDSIEDFSKLLENKKKILVIGAESSGKSTLLKNIYLSVMGTSIPLFLSIENRTRINPKNFVRHLFEEQYGTDASAYERYLQIDKKRKILLIDNWDLLDKRQNLASFSSVINSLFEIVICTCSSNDEDIIKEIKQEITESSPVCQVKIKPFFAEKRSQLIKNIYSLNSTNSDDTAYVNKLIDSVIKNNNGLFQLNPAFLIRYTNFLMRDPYFDYTKGEAAFSRVFEYELHQSIISISKKSDVDEIMTAIEEIAGYMYKSRNDILKLEEVREVIEQYKSVYGVGIAVRSVIEIGLRAKIFKQTEDYEIYFYNKNQLSYFIAKYLIRLSQNDPSDTSGITYALKNICFGINADIVLFISYLSGNTRIIMSIVDGAKELLNPWKPIELSNSNISLLSMNTNASVLPPTAEEQKEYENKKDEVEEASYPDKPIEAIGLFDYDDTKIDEYQFRIVRSIKYTEMICKSLPAFYSNLKIPQKMEIVNAIYSYPRKITYALLRPIDIHAEDICNDILDFLDKNPNLIKTGKLYSKNDIMRMLNDYSRATFLSLVDHFTEICTSTKTFSLLVENDLKDASETIVRLLIIENSGNADALLKETESVLKANYPAEVKLMARLIVRKFILTNSELPFNKRQQLIDKILGKENRKILLLPPR